MEEELSGLEVSTTGKGTLGNIEAGWSVQEFATPVNANESAGGTGSVGYAGNDVTEALLLVNNEATASNDLGELTGRIRQVNKTGQRVTVAQDTKLSRYDVEATLPPMISGSVPAALSLAEAILGDTGYNPPDETGNYWSLNGHAVGFTPEGEQVTQGSTSAQYLIYDTGTASFVQSDPIVTYSGTLDPSGFAVFNNKYYATGVTGDSYKIQLTPVPTLSGPFIPTLQVFPSFVLYGKIILDGDDLTFQMLGQPFGPADGDYGQTITASIDYSADTMTVSVERRTGGLVSTVTATSSIASLDRDAELAFRIHYMYYGQYELSFDLANTSAYATIVSAKTGAFDADLVPVWFDRWTIAGNVRAIRYNNYSFDFFNTWPLAQRVDWESAQDFTFSGSLEVGEPAIGFNGVVWRWLQDACAVYRWELAVEDDTITARPVGGRTLSLDNVQGIPSLALDTSFAARQIDVNYADARIVSSDLVYDAREDNNRILSVEAGQTLVTTLQTDAYLTSILPPTRVTTFIPGAGTYYVVDSTGLPIVADQWEDYGGSVQVALDPNNAGAIVVTLKGPGLEIPSTTSPYSLAVSDGVNQYAALSILGSGVVGDPKVLNLRTGANVNIAAQEVGFTITNAFIGTLEQALDTGIWASVDASGPRMTLTATVPSSELEGFGLTAGSLVSYQNSIYRVLSAGIGRTSTSLTCTRHVTVADFDAVWDGQQVYQHDDLWLGYLCEDQKVLPLKSS